MKKLIYAIIVIVALGLIVAGCTTSVVPPTEQNEPGLLPNKSSSQNIPVTIDVAGRPTLVGTITSDGASIIFHIQAIGQADDGDNINTSKYYSQTNFDNEYFTISAAGKFLKYNMFSGTTPYWGTSWSASDPLPTGVTFSQTQDGNDFVYDVSMSYAILGISEGDTFWVQIKARDFNDDFVQSCSYIGYEGFDGLYSQYRGLWITDTRLFEVTLPVPPIEVEIDIKPGSGPNSINLKSKGVVPVAVLTTDDFDACTIKPTTVEFAGASPERWVECDVDGDSDTDLLFHFKTQGLVSLDENSTEATLTGETYGGNPIEGTDTVNIVPKK